MIKVLELFAGIGAVRKALINTSIEHEVIGISEIDKYAIQSYTALYGETKNYGDVTQINPELLPDFDLLVFGFPCQDISLAGAQEGLDENSGTRSSLLWTTVNIIRHKKPKFLLMENVKNLVGQKHKKNFEKYLMILKELGYNSTYKVLNANHFGVPQNRERIVCVSVFNEIPKILNEGAMTSKTIKDILDKEVEEKYFMDKPFILREPSFNKNTGLIQVATLEMKATESIKRVYSKDGLCPTLTTMGGGHREPKILDGDKVRKLTPRECWKLMGFTEEDFGKVNFLSNAQLYKQAGNSICVPMFESVLNNLIK